ncbi:Uncharacterised protein [Mycobacterium tuberculosis]|uniref:Uncharacterized protein n=1 Tax=Mycobacterium tuberculosis TaxID=1773 RepID=A0A0U0U8T1_MYCTX|nr:Uncharacterised protein [Mycobacterium tuberculosis]CFE90143.1 Uncharacterised protein [Mycobacterium tuberculosis]COV16859.1 Uncharacterised protein [Mycobacterium tuberculosis]COY71946.1 Uncharacterised protein [Mycobacterium tuberculosis]
MPRSTRSISQASRASSYGPGDEPMSAHVVRSIATTKADDEPSPDPGGASTCVASWSGNGVPPLNSAITRR